MPKVTILSVGKWVGLEQVCSIIRVYRLNIGSLYLKQRTMQKPIQRSRLISQLNLLGDLKLLTAKLLQSELLDNDSAWRYPRTT